MKKHLGKLILILILLLIHNISAQNERERIDSINSIGYEKIVSNLQYYLGVFNDNLALARSINYEKGEGLALSNLALVHYLKGNYDKSTEHHLLAIEIFEKNKMYKELSQSYGEYGYQLKRRDLDKALDYMRHAINLAVGNNLEELMVAKLYDNYGVLQEMKGNLDSTFYFYTQALQIKEKYSDSLGIPFSLNKIAVLKAVQGNFNDAYYYLSKSDEYREKEKGDFGRAENLSIKADFLRMENKIDSAVIFYEKCLQTASAIGYNYLISYCYSYLTELHKRKGDYKQALEYFEKYKIYQDSLSNYQINSTIAQLEIAYETEQKNKLIRENELQLSNKNQQVVFLIITVIFLIITSTGIYKYQKQKRDKLTNELALRTKINEVLIEKRIAQEKLEIAKELHDNIGSKLTFLVSSIDNIILKHKSNSVNAELISIKDFGKDTIKDLRNTVWAMKHESGDVESLIVKIYDFLSKLKYVALEIKVENLLSKPVKLSSTQMLNLFRIVQESVQNTLKHSGASKLVIKFQKVLQGFELIIEDNGCGFDVNNEFSGNGLRNIKQRSEKSGGSCKIISNSSGTKIICAINCP